MTPETLIKLGPFLSPLIVALLSKLFINPGKEEAKLSRFRINFLETIRLEVSLELAKLLPVKKAKSDMEDYTPIVKEKLTEYLESNSEPIIDFYNSEKIWERYICWLRVYKYSLLVIPSFGVLAIIALYYYPQRAIWQIASGAALIVVILIFVVVVERFKDKYMDLCNKYEVVDYDQKDN